MCIYCCRLMSKYSCISSFHGKGLMFGIEIASSKTEDDKNQRPNSKTQNPNSNRTKVPQTFPYYYHSGDYHWWWSSMNSNSALELLWKKVSTKPADRVGLKIDECVPLGFNTSSSLPAESSTRCYSQHVNNTDITTTKWIVSDNWPPNDGPFLKKKTTTLILGCFIKDFCRPIALHSYSHLYKIHIRGCSWTT